MYNIIVLTFLLQTTLCAYENRIITTRKYSKYMVKPTIVNGSPVEVGKVPYLVSIKEAIRKTASDTVWKNICGGSIISELKVLTAAHCFENNDFYFARHPIDLRVVAGHLRNNIVHPGDTETTKQAQWRLIKRVILHKHFIFPNNDIALVIVNIPWDFTTGAVDSINLAMKASDYLHYCMSAGYGRVGPSLKDTISPVLLVARIDVMSRWKCSLWWEMNMNSFLCTDSAVTDVARGDSGGPLACHGTSDPNEKDGKDLLVGVVSGKNYDKTTLYTRVSAHYNWIMRNGSYKLYVDVFVLIILLVLIYLLF